MHVQMVRHPSVPLVQHTVCSTCQTAARRATTQNGHHNGRMCLTEYLEGCERAETGPCRWFLEGHTGSLSGSRCRWTAGEELPPD